MNMEGEPNPDDHEKAGGGSSSGSRGFICTVCFKVFHNGQALGGHQNAHHMERSLRQTTPNILGAVLNHLPLEEVHSVASALAASRNTTTRTEAEAAGRENHNRRVEPRRPRNDSSHQYHPYDIDSSSRRRPRIKNLLGEWQPINGRREDTSSGVPMISNDPLVEVSMVETINLELSLKPCEILDLELKLGF
ncbi:hypothetical protein Tsubulata_026438 [Turnera subulata]|uniref:C2H2-type domain-containing protein n=1 Tax=Turnera subulata TaxID=218843 RepID=A0A9Q0FP74_9ROSI|nr:hypothetical protein Tsubulata_026438 [Turnera subulata]